MGKSKAFKTVDTSGQRKSKRISIQKYSTPVISKGKALCIQPSTSVPSTRNKKKTSVSKNHMLWRNAKSSFSDSGIDSPIFSISKSSLRSKRKLDMSEKTSVINNSVLQPKSGCCSTFEVSNENFKPVFNIADAPLSQADSGSNSDPEITFNFTQLKQHKINLAPLPNDFLAFKIHLDCTEDSVDYTKHLKVSTPEKELVRSDMLDADMVDDTEITLYETPKKLPPIKPICGSPSSASSDSCFWEEVELTPDNGAIVIHNFPLKEIEESVKKPAETCHLGDVDISLRKSSKTYNSPHQFKKHLFKEKKQSNRSLVSGKKSVSQAREEKLDQWASFMSDHLKDVENTTLCWE